MFFDLLDAQQQKQKKTKEKKQKQRLWQEKRNKSPIIWLLSVCVIDQKPGIIVDIIFIIATIVAINHNNNNCHLLLLFHALQKCHT